MVIREDYPYIEEQIEEDDRLAKLMKGKTKEQVITTPYLVFKGESSVTLLIVAQENS